MQHHYETPHVTPIVISIESKLTEHWEQTLKTAELMTDNAYSNLARLGLLYSGQLSFELDV